MKHANLAELCDPPSNQGFGGLADLRAKGRRFLQRTVLICVLLSPPSAFAVVVRHDLSADAYRALAAQEPFAGVVEIEVDTGLGLRRGSGVVVAGQWVLTAAHVTWGAVAAGVRVRDAAGSLNATELRYAAGWSAFPVPGLTQGNDLVLIGLAESSDLGAATIASTLAAGEVGFFGGFGRGGNGILGASGAAGLTFAMNVVDRRIALSGGGGLLVTDFDDGSSARNALDAETARRTYYDTGYDDPQLTSTVLDAGSGASLANWDALPTAADYFPGLAAEFLEGTSAPGDSGGPLFVLNRATGGWELAGLSSWGVNPLLPDGFARGDSRYGDLAFHTDLSVHREWILATVPEPSAVILWIVGFVLTGRRQR